MSFEKVLEKYRKYSFSERDKGDRFERLMQAYLLTDPQFADKIQEVWLWSEFIHRGQFGGNDTGIDLIAKTIEGDYWAIQCKCYQETATIDKPAVDSFLSTSSREFVDSDNRTIKFAHRLWISTTNKWGSNAEQSIRNQNPAVSRVSLYDLQQAPVDWDKLELGISGDKARNIKKELREHQIQAVESTNKHFQTADRGKLVMACGTGKTFTSLRIAENETNGKGLILFLVPSIALLGQTLREWSADAKESINAICICSDSEITKKRSKNDDADTTSTVDLALPASTNIENITKQFRNLKNSQKQGVTVVFSTYQSIEVIAKAQRELKKTNPEYGSFDLIICDEAHRTTGVALTKEDSTDFIKVHDNDFISAKKRLYMTATPRLYGDDAKSKANKNDAILCSMDDPKIYGEEIYRIGFGEAVERGFLTDYKVLILTLSDKDVPPAVQKMISDESNEIKSSDASKFIGCINALSKQILGDNGIIKATDPNPMKRAVAFCQNIDISEKITGTFNTATNAYLDSLPKDKKAQMVFTSSKHIDGTMSAPQRDELLGWLKSEQRQEDECRILTNVRCLSEGVDVPSLDAVIFLSPKNSQVDVVQSVGRVMRKSEGKKYGYIIIPVVIPSDVEADKALDDNEKYKVVWSVLNALRSHDDRFNATVNQIELNHKKPDQILVGKPQTTFEDGKAVDIDPKVEDNKNAQISQQMALQFEKLQNVVFARMVLKVGDRGYWEQWARDVSIIAQNQIDRINNLIKQEEHKQVFEEFLEGLRKNINPSITASQAVEMLSQHIITKPVFEALFEGYSFVKNNAISVSMQSMMDVLENQAFDKDTQVLDKFYESVRMRAKGIDNAEGRQKIIIELYDKFFKTAFPKMVEQLGIVYTPVEVVDFIIRSVDDVLQKEFDRKLSDENVHILDPFTGTGTFMTRLLQSGLIDPKDLARKYQNELHANEIVLLAYYIAAINIENTYHDLAQNQEYKPFEGIVLTDTFQMAETDDGQALISSVFQENSERVEKQKKAPLRVIIGNPPYSVGQKSANDNAQNMEYKKLNSRIDQTYAQTSSATNKNSLYNSYIKAFRWSSDRLDPQNGGIIAFVSNGNWIDVNATDGFRKSLENEFSSIYVFKLRGNQRTKGELSRKEGGKIFGEGCRDTISITILVKKPNSTNKATISYKDIGDYHSREEKLKIIKNFKSVNNIPWQILEPNEHGDWISQRNDIFSTFIPLNPDKKFDHSCQSFFTIYSMGAGSSRDSWVYNSSKLILEDKVRKTIDFYNQQVKEFKLAKANNPTLKVEGFIDRNPQKISWSSSLIPNVERGNSTEFESDKIVSAMYRPFFKQNLYYGDKLIHRYGQFRQFFPIENTQNLLICCSPSSNDALSVLISDKIADIHFNGDTQCFPLYYYEEREKSTANLFDPTNNKEYIRRDGISDFILKEAKNRYGNSVTKEDMFYYVYGFLHSPQYREMFASDLKKMLPKLPLVDLPSDFWSFSKTGRKLADLYLNYEEVPPLESVKVTGEESGFFEVEKMRFEKNGKDADKSTIYFNSKITISNIPDKAYKYIVNGKSAIEWIMERYQITTHKDSLITNNPNDWAKENGKPRYILDLLLSVINLSIQTVDLVQGLPKVEFGDGVL